MKKWLSITLGIVTATGGVLDAGTVATSGEAGAKFGLDRALQCALKENLCGCHS